jgi:VanZ family protein
MMAAIFYFSAQSFDGQQLAWWEVVMRKLGHVTGYALLAAAWAWALYGRVRRPLVWAAGAAFAYAISDEYHQTFVEGRGGTPVDVAIDSIGIGIVLLFSRGGALRRGAHPQRA